MSVFWGWDVRDTDTGGRVLLMRGVEYWVWVGGQVVVNFFFFFFAGGLCCDRGTAFAVWSRQCCFIYG